MVAVALAVGESVAVPRYGVLVAVMVRVKVLVNVRVIVAVFTGVAVRVAVRVGVTVAVPAGVFVETGAGAIGFASFLQLHENSAAITRTAKTNIFFI
jgi:hypothetical protein